MAVAEQNQSSIGFWAGYKMWLAGHKRWFAIAFGLLLLAFALALWVSRSPADPFAYGDFQ